MPCITGKRARRGRAKTATAKRASLITAMAVLGHSSHAIARHLDDGTTPESIRHQLATWGVFDLMPKDLKKRVAVRMHPKAIQKAQELAEGMGIPVDVWAGRVVEFAARDGMYESIVDGEGEAYV